MSLDRQCVHPLHPLVDHRLQTGGRGIELRSVRESGPESGSTEALVSVIGTEAQPAAADIRIETASGVGAHLETETGVGTEKKTEKKTGVRKGTGTEIEIVIVIVTGNGFSTEEIAGATGTSERLARSLGPTALMDGIPLSRITADQGRVHPMLSRPREGDRHRLVQRVDTIQSGVRLLPRQALYAITQRQAASTETVGAALARHTISARRGSRTIGTHAPPLPREGTADGQSKEAVASLPGVRLTNSRLDGENTATMKSMSVGKGSRMMQPSRGRDPER